jgi:hypothetical protein
VIRYLFTIPSDLSTDVPLEVLFTPGQFPASKSLLTKVVPTDVSLTDVFIGVFTELAPLNILFPDLLHSCDLGLFFCLDTGLPNNHGSLYDNRCFNQKQTSELKSARFDHVITYTCISTILRLFILLGEPLLIVQWQLTYASAERRSYRL